MDAPRTWQAVSVATAAVALGVGAALLRTPESLPAPPIELAVVEPVDRDPSLGVGDRLTTPVLPAADPRIVLPQLQEGRAVSAASATSTASPDEPASGSGSGSSSTGSGTSSSGGGSTSSDSGSTSSGSGSGSSSSSTGSGGSSTSGTTRSSDPDSSASVASPSSADSD